MSCIVFFCLLPVLDWLRVIFVSWLIFGVAAVASLPSILSRRAATAIALFSAIFVVTSSGGRGGLVFTIFRWRRSSILAVMVTVIVHVIFAMFRVGRRVVGSFSSTFYVCARCIAD